MTKLPTGRHTQEQKSVRKSGHRALRNKSFKSNAKTCVRKFREILDSSNIDEAKKNLSATVRSLDKAAAKGAIHKKKASRLKSRIQKRLNKISLPKT